MRLRYEMCDERLADVDTYAKVNERSPPEAIYRAARVNMERVTKAILKSALERLRGDCVSAECRNEVKSQLFKRLEVHFDHVDEKYAPDAAALDAEGEAMVSRRIIVMCASSVSFLYARPCKAKALLCSRPVHTNHTPPLQGRSVRLHPA